MIVIISYVELKLNYHIGFRYNGRKNLKSAQMDLVVVCPKGVFMIEVKNWTDEYAQQNNRDLSPHEQTERAGRVLWIALQKKFGDGECGVTNVLLSILKEIYHMIKDIGQCLFQAGEPLTSS